MIKISSLRILMALPLILALGCNNKGGDNLTDETQQGQKIGVLLVNHGSHSDKWREMLTALSDSVRDDIMQNKNITSVRSAFMEYNEPSIATRMKEFDKEGFTDVIIVPIFLTVSSHSHDDIPHIVGLKNVQSNIDMLKQEAIECYKAKAKVTITPLLDFPDILGKNLVRRLEKISENPENEGVVLVAYGDQQYNKEWTKLLDDMYAVINKETGINEYQHSWCGHIVHYETEPTTTAIEKALEKKEKAIVMPVLVAFDEMFQVQIIGGAIDKVKEKEKVIYKPDAILPDKNIEDWIIDITNKTTSQILN